MPVSATSMRVRLRSTRAPDGAGATVARVVDLEVIDGEHEPVISIDLGPSVEGVESVVRVRGTLVGGADLVVEPSYSVQSVSPPKQAATARTAEEAPTLVSFFAWRGAMSDAMRQFDLEALAATWTSRHPRNESLVTAEGMRDYLSRSLDLGVQEKSPESLWRSALIAAQSYGRRSHPAGVEIDEENGWIVVVAEHDGSWRVVDNVWEAEQVLDPDRPPRTARIAASRAVFAWIAKDASLLASCLAQAPAPIATVAARGAADAPAWLTALRAATPTDPTTPDERFDLANKIGAAEVQVIDADHATVEILHRVKLTCRREDARWLVVDAEAIPATAARSAK